VRQPVLQVLARGMLRRTYVSFRWDRQVRIIMRRGGEQRSWGHISRSAWAPALCVLLVYGAWLLGMFLSGHGARDFLYMGRKYVYEPNVKPLFKPDPRYPYISSSSGYDGQFSYYIALDPVNARFHVDQQNYRYTRILYPMTARLLSLDQGALIPYMLIAINLLALYVGTLVLALLLAHWSLSPWLALVYGLSPGLFVCLHRDLEEPLAFGLVILGMYLYTSGGRQRFVWSAVSFALAVLTRESVAVFPAIVGISLLGSASTPITSPRPWLRSGFFLSLALGPFAVYKAFLWYWLGPSSSMAPAALYPRLIPFSGLFALWPWNALQIQVAMAVVAPALICTMVGVQALWRRMATTEVWLLLTNVVLFVVMLNPLTYGNILGSARVTTGVVLAAILCLPVFHRCTRGNRGWFWLSTACWFTAWPSLVPFYGWAPGPKVLLLNLGGVLVVGALTRQIPAPSKSLFYARRKEER